MADTSLLLAYYGDDFTGSTDALEFLSRAGARTALFIAPPSPAQLAGYPGLQAIGVAGMTRSMTPDAMEAELRPAFTALRALGVPHVHYKVCSTFDSSPTIGSIGRATDVGADIFKSRFVPLVVGAPPLGRYCLFGNLFARMGIGSDGEIYRLDRHPSMSKHPVTPADESDLRRHLAKQTVKRIGLMDILQIARPEIEARAALEQLFSSGIAAGAEVVLFDVLTTDHLVRIGALIDGYASREHPLFSVGSSAIEMALGAHWANSKHAPAAGGAPAQLQAITSWPDPGKADPLLVISGSCSPVTEKQMNFALAHGFAEVALDTAFIAGHDDPSRSLYDTIAEVCNHLRAGRSVILHTSRGSADPRLAATANAFKARGWDQGKIRTLTAQIFGTALGKVARSALERQPVKRLVIAGGDTSSYAARALGIESVEMIAPLAPGAPLCRAHAPASPADGLEVNFKGGQVGGENYFAAVAQGHL